MKRNKSVMKNLVLSFWAVLVILSSMGCSRYQPIPQAETGEAAVTAATTLTTTNQSVSGIWYEYIKPADQFTNEQGQMLAEYVSGRLFRNEAPDAEVENILKSDLAARIVYLSISDGYSAAQVFSATGTGIRQAIENVFIQANEAIAKGLEPQWVQFDIVHEVTILTDVDIQNPQPLEYERSLFGLAFDRYVGLAFLPQELVVRTLVDSKRKIRMDNIQEYLEFTGKEDSNFALDLALQNKLITLYRFTTLSYFTDGKETFSLYRGHRMFDEITSQEAFQSAVAGGSYLARSVGPDGRFIYLFYPKTNSIPNDYNIVRHAGSVWGMLELYDVAPTIELREAINRSMKFELLGQATKDCTFQGKEYLCIVENKNVKLGSNALGAIALSKYMEITGDRQYMDEMLAYGNWALATMDPISGEFLASTVSHPGGEITSKESQYFPGETILAFLRIYRMDKNAKWLDAAEKAAQYLINVRDAGKEINELQHDHWLLYALNELYRERPNAIYLEHTLKIAQGIINKQNLNPPYPDWMGSYYNPPRSTPAATRSEGMLAAYKLVRDFGKPEDAEAILKSVEKLIAFQLQTQFRPETTMFVDNPQYVMGAFHADLTNFEIRNDYVQHNVASLVAYYDVTRPDAQ
jgi:hypothetical protein